MGQNKGGAHELCQRSLTVAVLCNRTLMCCFGELAGMDKGARQGGRGMHSRGARG